MITELEKTVIDNIRKIRRERGLTQEKLAELSGTSPSYIGHVEIYKYVPTVSTIQKLAEAMNVSPAEFFMPRDDIRPRRRPRHSRQAIQQVKKRVLSNMERELTSALKMLE